MKHRNGLIAVFTLGLLLAVLVVGLAVDRQPACTIRLAVLDSLVTGLVMYALGRMQGEECP